MKIKLKLTAWAILTYSQIGLTAEIPTAVINGNTDNRNSLLALTHATVHLNASETITNATLVVKDNEIVSINTASKPPENAQELDYSGMHIYPGFIHLDSSIGLPEPAPRPPFQWGKSETLNTTLPGAYNSNEAIKASFEAAKNYTTDNKENAKLRAAGFTAALSHRKDGIMRGTSVLLHLADQADAKNIISPQAALVRPAGRPRRNCHNIIRQRRVAVVIRHLDNLDTSGPFRPDPVQNTILAQLIIIIDRQRRAIFYHFIDGHHRHGLGHGRYLGRSYRGL